MAPMTTASALAIVRELRPQAFGDARPQSITDPIIEPLWSGIRVLAAVESESSGLFDSDGDRVTDFAALEAELRAHVAADGAVIDGYLTKQPTHEGPPDTAQADWMPRTTDILAHSFVGSSRSKAAEASERLERQRAATTFGPDDIVVFVAVDLLYLDGESMLDVPLLERKRQLEATIVESDLVRLGAYVRPPLGAWISSWRTLGFAGMTYTAANGRYRPGGDKNDWATAPMPRR
jgi:ATP-dependent DNA ligase